MLEQLPARLGVDIFELAGAHVSGEIPVPASVINRLIAAHLQQTRTPVASLVAEPHDGQMVVVHVRLRSPLVPPLTVRALIEEQPRLPAAPVIVIRWSLTGLGVLARLASPVLSLFDLLPPGISIDGDRAAVDLAQVLAAQGQGDVLPLLTHLDISTADGRFVVRFAGRIPEGGVASASTAAHPTMEPPPEAS